MMSQNEFSRSFPKPTRALYRTKKTLRTLLFLMYCERQKSQKKKKKKNLTYDLSLRGRRSFHFLQPRNFKGLTT